MMTGLVNCEVKRSSLPSPRPSTGSAILILPSRLKKRLIHYMIYLPFLYIKYFDDPYNPK